MAEIIMPKMGDAMEEGRIVQWLKNVGDTVAADEAVAEIETDKSNVEIEAPEAGTIQSIAYQAGDVAPVGSVIAVIGSGPVPAAAPKEASPTPAPAEEPAPAPAAPAASSNGAAPAVGSQAVEEEGALAQQPAAPPADSSPRPVAAPVAAQFNAAPFRPYDSFVGGLPENLGGSASIVGEPLPDGGTVFSGTEHIKASPLARAMARGNNLDLAALRGSGANGEIVKRDVEAALASGGRASAAPVPSTTAPVPAAEGDEVQEYNAMRRTIAKRLAESKATIPHFYVTSEIDMEALLALREEVNAGAGENAPKVTLNDFLVKATAVALSENPVVNAVFSENRRILRKAVHIGIAVSIDDGLIVPVVRDCQTKSLRAIARETRPLIEKARTMKLKPEEYTGGTFTISNLGQYDVEDFAAIINPGEGAILAISSIRPTPAVVDEQVVPRKRMKVTLCADHRVLDGVAGALFLQSLKRVIENPLNILL